MNRATKKITVLYKISNSGSDEKYYNSFQIPFANGVKLSTIKQHSVALRYLNHAGAEGYHWRIRMEDKSNTSTNKYRWWDIIDENARLPLINTSLIELGRILEIQKVCYSTSDISVAKGAIRSLGKAMNKVASTVDGISSSQVDSSLRLYIIVFKLVDMIKVHNSLSKPITNNTPRVIKSESPQYLNKNTQLYQDANALQNEKVTPSYSRKGDFKNIHLENSYYKSRQSKPISDVKHQSNFIESSLINIQPEYNIRQTKMKTNHQTSSSLHLSRVQNSNIRCINNFQNRVWDDIEERWVVCNQYNPSSNRSGKYLSQRQIKGISLDSSSAIGKSTKVADAIYFRVNRMIESQHKAVMDFREREILKKKNEASEDAARLRFEPKIREWCEEHGKKKQLRALLSSLHNILWPEANWKPVNLGEILDDRKCKLCFHKAIRVVHPDKTISLGPINKFLAKRIFDALSQANAKFYEEKK